jgi:protein-S-isoprenylcysteine O-methyltransferase Ste14
MMPSVSGRPSAEFIRLEGRMNDVSFDREMEPLLLGNVQRRRKLALTIAGASAILMLPFTRTMSEETLPSEIMEIVGVVLIVFAILGRSWCTFYIGGRKGQEIIALGPYSVSRNPLYFFSLIGIFGIGAQTGSLLLGPILLAIGLAIFIPVILAEERALLRRFGQVYRSYLDRVPRFGPRASEWRDAEIVPAYPARVLRTATEGMLLLLALPICESAEWFQEVGYLPALIQIP